MDWSRYLPLVGQLKGYDSTLLRSDFFAGITVCIMLVPQGMAYALLAGMPPIYGLYGALIPLLVYGVLGTSRQLSIGPVAVSALLVLAGISQLAEPESGTYIMLVILTGFLIGIAQLALSLLRLGFLANFLSHPVIMGFTSAAAIIIAASQLKYLFGIDIPRFEQASQTIGYAFSHLTEIHWLSFAFCVGGILVMLAMRKWLPRWPAALLVSVAGILITALLRLDQQGLSIVGVVPEGLPGFALPSTNMEHVRMVLPTVFTVTIIGIVESLGIAKALEMKNKDGKVRPNQELFALGASKVLGSFFQALPSSASFTRSAINNEAGAKTGMASIVAALATGLTLIFFTPLFYYLPKAILAAIVLMAVRSLFEIKEAINLLRVHRMDFLMLLLTFIITLSLGIEEGVLAGVVLSLVVIIFQASRPHVAILGQLPETVSFRNIKRFPKAEQFPGIVIMRFDAPLFFLNAEFFKEIIMKTIKDQEDTPKLLVLDASSILDIDSGGLDAITEVHEFLTKRGISFYLCGILGPVRDRMHQAGVAEGLGLQNQFLRIRDAVVYYQQQADGTVNWSEDAVQHNLKNKDRT